MKTHLDKAAKPIGETTETTQAAPYSKLSLEPSLPDFGSAPPAGNIWYCNDTEEYIERNLSVLEQTKSGAPAHGANQLLFSVCSVNI